MKTFGKGVYKCPEIRIYFVYTGDVIRMSCNPSIADVSWDNSMLGGQE